MAARLAARRLLGHAASSASASEVAARRMAPSPVSPHLIRTLPPKPKLIV
jgi:hypothetical protein